MVELVVVITVVGILAAITVPKFVGAKEESQVAATAGDLRAIANAVSMYHAAHGQYPRDVTPERLVSELSDYFKDDNPFAKGVPIGGVYDYEGPPHWDPVQISIRQRGQNRFTDQVALDLDEYLDDGNLQTGSIRRDNRYGDRITYYFAGQ